MRGLTVLLIAGMIVGLVRPANATALQIELRNRSSNPAYVVTAFASELVPNFRNLTTIPLTSGSRRVVTVFDNFDKCIFTFTVDYNDPRQTRRPTRQARRAFAPIRVIPDVNICQQKSLDLQ